MFGLKGAYLELHREASLQDEGRIPCEVAPTMNVSTEDAGRRSMLLVLWRERVSALA